MSGLTSRCRVAYEDTNAAIAGGLLGARDGVAGIPSEWLAVLQFGEEFRAAVRRLSVAASGEPAGA